MDFNDLYALVLGDARGLIGLEAVQWIWVARDDAVYQFLADRVRRSAFDDRLIFQEHADLFFITYLRYGHKCAVQELFMKCLGELEFVDLQRACAEASGGGTASGKLHGD